MKTKLVLIRHGESLWNKENRFTGLTDICLSENGIRQARNAAVKLSKSGIKIDIAFTSELSRAYTTADIIIDQQNESYWRDIYNQASIYNLSDNSENTTPKPHVYKNANLNERDYGFLTGKNKTEIVQEYGEEQVHKWRRGYLDRPPSGENLEDVYNRVSSYYNFEIKPHLEKTDGVMIGRAAYHTPYLLADIEREIFNNEDVPSRQDVIEQLIPYVKEELKKGTRLNQIMRHTLGLFHGQTGASYWKRYLSENMCVRDADVKKIDHIMDKIKYNNVDTRVGQSA